MAIYRPLDDESVFTVQEFAAMFKLSQTAVRKGIANGDIPGQKIGGVYRAFVAATRSYTGDDESDQG